MRFNPLMLLIPVLVTACEKPSPEPEPQVVHVEKVILPKEVEVGLAEKFQVECEVLPENATDKRVRWIMTDSTIASVNKNGVITGLRKGLTALKAESVEDNTKYGVAYITVVDSEMKLRADMVSTNAPMQYVCWGWTDDGDWDDTLGNRAITPAQAESRRLNYDNPERMWDSDPSTCFCTNFDIYKEGKSWGIRSGATTTYNYIAFTFDEQVSLLDLYITVSDVAWFSKETHGYRIETSEDGVTYMDPDTADDGSIGRRDSSGLPGEEIVIKNFSGPGGKKIKGLKIVPNHGCTSVGSLDGPGTRGKGYFGLAEVKIIRKGL